MFGRKFAVFTVDAEEFGETECVKYSSLRAEDDMMDGLSRYIDLIEGYGIKGTVFTLLGTAEKYRGLLSELAGKGHEIALHGYRHTAPMLIEPHNFGKETALAKESLSQMFGCEIKGFRAPCFSLDTERLDIIKGLGFAYDASFMNFSPARHHAAPDFSNWNSLADNVYELDGFFEFGLVTGHLFGAKFPASGGGYLRLMSDFLFKPFIRQCIKNADCYVFYLHPFEFSEKRAADLKGAKAYDRFYLTHGISGFVDKVRFLISELAGQGFELVTFSELSELCGEHSEADARTNNQSGTEPLSVPTGRSSLIPR